MSEKQKQLVEDILGSSEKMPEAYQQRLIGVAYGLELAQGLGMAPRPAEKDTASATKNST